MDNENNPKENGCKLSRKLIVALLIIAALLAAYFIFLKVSSRFQAKQNIQEETLSASGESLRFEFNKEDALKSWREFSFNRKSEYKIEPNEYGEKALHAKSRDAYSTIFKIMNISVDTRPILSWQWRAVKFPSGKKRTRLGAPDENDFAIRVCAVFTKNNPFASDVIQYVWDDYFPEETVDKSPYKKSVRIIVAQSGQPDPKNYWTTENRDVVKDYERVFGKKPDNDLRAISIISNSDDTHTESEAYIRNIEIRKSATPPPEKKKLFDLQKGIRDTQTNIKKVLDFFTAPFKRISPPRKKGREELTAQPVPIAAQK